MTRWHELLFPLAVVVLLFGAPAGSFYLTSCIVAADRDRARDEGRHAARVGVPPEACPYGDGNRLREHWMRGWADGYEETNPPKKAEGR